jgi:poly [ADP-ribose] polymerase 2/3/4
MNFLNYDADKLPLGNLSEGTLRKGYIALRNISELLGDPTIAQSRYSSTHGAALSMLTSRYYTVIPHVFGRHKPPVITTIQQLKREAELLESLGEMEIAAEIMANVLISLCQSDI